MKANEIKRFCKELETEMLKRVEIGSLIETEWQATGIVEVPGLCYNTTLPNGECVYTIRLGATKTVAQLMVMANQ